MQRNSKSYLSIQQDNLQTVLFQEFIIKILLQNNSVICIHVLLQVVTVNKTFGKSFMNANGKIAESPWCGILLSTHSSITRVSAWWTGGPLSVLSCHTCTLAFLSWDYKRGCTTDGSQAPTDETHEQKIPYYESSY